MADFRWWEAEPIDTYINRQIEGFREHVQRRLQALESLDVGAAVGGAVQSFAEALPRLPSPLDILPTTTATIAEPAAPVTDRLLKRPASTTTEQDDDVLNLEKATGLATDDVDPLTKLPTRRRQPTEPTTETPAQTLAEGLPDAIRRGAAMAGVYIPRRIERPEDFFDEAGQVIDALSAQRRPFPSPTGALGIADPNLVPNEPDDFAEAALQAARTRVLGDYFERGPEVGRGLGRGIRAFAASADEGEALGRGMLPGEGPGLFDDVPELASTRAAPTPEPEPPRIEQVPIDRIILAPEKYQRRTTTASNPLGVDEERVETIVRNFDPNKFDPIVLRRTEQGDLELLSGHHRLAAWQRLAAEGRVSREIPAIVRSGLTDVEAQEIARLGNISSKPYTPNERITVFSEAVNQRMAEGLDEGEALRAVAQQYGGTRVSEVRNAVDAAILPPGVRELLDDPAAGKAFTLDHAGVLARAMRDFNLDPAGLRSIVDRLVIQEQMSPHQLERALRTAGELIAEQGDLFGGMFDFSASGRGGVLDMLADLNNVVREIETRQRQLSAFTNYVESAQRAGEAVPPEYLAAARRVADDIARLEERRRQAQAALGERIMGAPAEADEETMRLFRQRIAQRQAQRTAAPALTETQTAQTLRTLDEGLARRPVEAIETPIRAEDLPRDVRERLPNLTKIGASGDVRSVFAQVARDNPDLIDRYRRLGITQRELVEDLAPRLGLTAEDFLKSPVGKALNEQELLVLRATVVQRTAQLAEKARDVMQRGGVGELSDTEKAQLLRDVLELAQLHAVGRGAASTAGRTLAQQKIAISHELAQALVGSNERIAAEQSLRRARDRQRWAERRIAELERERNRRLAQAAKAEEARVRREIEREQRKALAEAERVLKESRREAEAAQRRLERAQAAQARVAERQTRAAQKVLEKLGGREVTDRVLEQFVQVIDSGDALEVAKFVRGLQRVGWWDRIGIIRYGSMLSSTTTHLLNSASNLVNLGVDFALKPLAVALDIPRAALGIGGRERTQYLAELGPQAWGIVEGTLTGLKEAAIVMRTGIDPSEATKLERISGGFAFEQTRLGQALGERPSAAINVAAELPLRALTAADKIIRGAAVGGHLRALATRKAIQEGYTGAARARRVQEIVENVVEFPELVAEAQKRGARVVFQEKRPEIAPVLVFRSMPGVRYVAEVMIPFARVPYNVAAQGLGMTPAGVVAAIRAARAGETGEAVDRVARAVFGTAVMGVATSLAAAGYLTGAYPETETERTTLPPGWQPWSIRIPTRDGAVYVSFQGLGALAVPLAIAALYGDAIRRGERFDNLDLHSRVATGVGRYMADTTFLQGMGDLIRAIENPQRETERLIEGIATQFVPYGGFQRQLTRALGIAQRDPRGAIEAILAINPLTAGMVRERLGPLGEPVPPGATGIGAFIAPFRYSTEREDPVLRAFREAGVNLGEPDRTAQGIELTDDELREVQRLAGQYLREWVTPMQADPSFREMPAFARARVLENLRNSARRAAVAQVLSQLPADEYQRRFQTQLQQRFAPERVAVP